MAVAYKILGQINPSANTVSNVYVVPSSTSTVVSTIAICNLSGTATRFSLAVRPTNEALANKHYLTFNTSLPANDTIKLTWGITLGQNNTIVANVESSSVSISAFGSELT
jgi:hypothetical protein